MLLDQLGIITIRDVWKFATNMYSPLHDYLHNLIILNTAEQMRRIKQKFNNVTFFLYFPQRVSASFF